jgi:EAL domain-containing protein (putative c-di-GMP-specific phosphodiesterase class I)
MGRSLGMHVVAEGVETVEQAAFLESIWCERAQGFLYCRPLPADEFAAWVRAQGTVAPDANRGSPRTSAVVA